MNTAAAWVAIVNGDLPANPPSWLREHVASADHVVAVDGGLRHSVALGVWPSILLGDLDSASPELIELASEHELAIYPFPADKDATDLELALELALDSGASTLMVVAAFGGRLDHELATIALLASPRWKQMKIIAVDGPRQLHVVHDSCDLQLDVGSTVSLIPWHGSAAGVGTRGLQWPLHDALLAAGTTHGVSNVAVEPVQHVVVESGVLVVVADATTHDLG